MYHIAQRLRSKPGFVDKKIALTFDDGPNEPYTSELLDFADNHGVKLTLFQVGACVKRFPEITKRADEAGHIIGSHTFSHTFSRYFNRSAIRYEVEENQRILQQVLGKKPVLFRAPWFFYTPTLHRTLRRSGLRPVFGLWPYYCESVQPSARRIARYALLRARPNAILIMHDGNGGVGGSRRHSIEAAKLTIAGLQAQGYTFVTVDELLNVAPYAAIAD